MGLAVAETANLELRSAAKTNRFVETAPGSQKRCSMSQAIVDPAEVRRFAHNLTRFNNELQSQMVLLRGQLIGLGQTWRDQEQEKFVQSFEETMLVLSRFIDASNQQIPLLLRKAERVEEYLRQR